MGLVVVRRVTALVSADDTEFTAHRAEIAELLVFWSKQLIPLSYPAPTLRGRGEATCKVRCNRDFLGTECCRFSLEAIL
jgi:hypothetical protein